MNSSNVGKHDQDWIVAYMRRLGYKKNPHDGICFGAGMMSAHAALVLDVASFTARIQRLRHFAAMQTVPPSANEKNDFLSFFDSVELLQHPEDYESLLSGENNLQQSLPAEELTQSIMLQEKGGVVKIAQFTTIYNLGVLMSRFTELTNITRQVPVELPHPVVLLMQSSDHLIQVTYEHDSKIWHLFNAKKFEMERYFGVEEITKAVFAALKVKRFGIITTTMLATLAAKIHFCYMKTLWKETTAYQHDIKITETKAQYQDEHGITWLMMAVMHDDISRCRSLLKAGADPNAKRHKDGSTPLFMAATIGDVEKVQLLLDSGAEVDMARASDGRTALMAAAQYGRNHVVRLLLMRGAHINYKNDDGSTATYIAAACNQVDTVRLLLSRPDVDIFIARENDGYNALSIAVANDFKEVVALLSTYADKSRVLSPLDKNEVAGLKQNSLLRVSSGNQRLASRHVEGTTKRRAL